MSVNLWFASLLCMVQPRYLTDVMRVVSEFWVKVQGNALLKTHCIIVFHKLQYAYCTIVVQQQPSVFLPLPPEWEAPSNTRFCFAITPANWVANSQWFDAGQWVLHTKWEQQLPNRKTWASIVEVKSLVAEKCAKQCTPHYYWIVRPDNSTGVVILCSCPLSGNGNLWRKNVIHCMNIPLVSIWSWNDDRKTPALFRLVCRWFYFSHIEQFCS